jgi:hypothetical protein
VMMIPPSHFPPTRWRCSAQGRDRPPGRDAVMVGQFVDEPSSTLRSWSSAATSACASACHRCCRRSPHRRLDKPSTVRRIAHHRQVESAARRRAAGAGLRRQRSQRRATAMQQQTLSMTPRHPEHAHVAYPQPQPTSAAL